MPIYRRYAIEVETTVRIRSLEGLDEKLVADFTVAGTAFADSDKKKLGENVSVAISRASGQAVTMAEVVENNEKQGMRG